MKIAIVEPISSGAALVKAAHRLGHEVFIISYNKEDRKLPAFVQELASGIIEFDTNNEQLFIEQVVKLHREQALSAIISGNEYYVPVTAKAAAKVNLKGINPDKVDNLRFKDQMRVNMQAAGLNNPDFRLIHGAEDIENLSEEMPFPCVLKPVGGAGSVHVCRVNDIGQLTEAYSQAQKDERRELGNDIGTKMLLESYIQGPEYSVDGYVNNTGTHILAVTEKLLAREPYFVEMGHLVPANIPTSVQADIEHYIKQTVACLGLDLGAFHAEIRLADKGPVLIEIGARLPGDKIVDLIQLARGIDLAEITVQLYLGQDDVQFPAQAQGYSGITFFSAEHLQQLSGVNGEDELHQIPGYVEHQLLKRPGENVPRLTDYRGRVAFAVFHHKEQQGLVNSLNRARQALSFY
ncbi:ATP-grasp domain-containing protein [Thalassomonas haliotis]|uniref:ATP-grasp domain-containing protein n=1 Tax=Thalassomonas haliotis TaxID=485448 RepID=A0ABY7VE44_9GAMM|nr:ATP-grasp domain-containing protein [Thalassomonas haliotis]WDE11836.1 ATP-grasp domain-containing protein [Thalassomonas haliotis]